MNQPNDDKINQWKNLIAEKKQSELTLKNFCKEKNITPAQFYYYHGIINRPTKIIKPENSNVTPIKIINSVSSDQNLIRFILPNNLQCLLPRNMPLLEIKAMLEVLMSC